MFANYCQQSMSQKNVINGRSHAILDDGQRNCVGVVEILHASSAHNILFFSRPWHHCRPSSATSPSNCHYHKIQFVLRVVMVTI